MSSVCINKFTECISHLIVAEEEDKADNLLEDGLHLLVATFADGRQCHQPGMAVFPIGWWRNKVGLTLTLTRNHEFGLSHFLTEDGRGEWESGDNLIL